MNRCKSLSTLSLIAMGLLLFGGGARWAAAKEAGGSHHNGMDKCAKACADCMRECESCARHCAHMVSKGEKDHFKTLGTCTDCSEFCASAAKIVSRHGPFATTICESCAKACDDCGAACEKFPDDKHMARCAKACRDCAKACRDMVKHASGAKEE
jgi:hypothetical protein